MYNLTLKIVAGETLKIRTETRAQAIEQGKAWMRKELGRNPTEKDVAFVKGYDEERAGFMSMIAPALSPSVKSGMIAWAKEQVA